MQINFVDITYDDKYVYATGTDLLTGVTKKIRISRTDDEDFWCEGGYETVFYRGAVVLMGTLMDKKKLPKEKCYMWE